MNNPLQITYHDITKNSGVEEVIEEKFQKILKENPGVTKCHVILEKQSRHHQKANEVHVRLDLKISRLEDVVVTQRCAEDPISIKSTVNKVFKEGIDTLRQAKKKLINSKRGGSSDFEVVDAEEQDEVV